MFRDTDRSDMLDESKTDSNLVALFQHIIAGGFCIGVMAVNSDHHYDGTTEHSAGLAFDGWPLNRAVWGDWVDSDKLGPYLKHVAAFPGIRNIGLAGTAYTTPNIDATGLLVTQDVESANQSVVFHDDGADHIHHGCHPA